MSSVKELGFFTERRRCTECGKYCKVVEQEGYLESACCNALIVFSGEKGDKQE